MSVPPEGVVRQLLTGDRFLIVGHVDPDPDSIGSTLALRRMLVALGKDCIAVTPTPLTPLLGFMPDVEHLTLPERVQPGTWEHLVVLDCGVERTGAIATQSSAAVSIVNIDHHATNPGTGTHNWVDAGYAATAQMIAGLCEPLRAQLDQATATLLYAGLVGDTGWFRFSNTSAAVLQMAATLLKYGVDIESLGRHLYESHSLTYLLLLGHVLQGVRPACGGRVITARVTQAMRSAVGAGQSEGEGFVQYLRLVQGAEVSVLFDELTDGRVRVQLRSSPGVNVAAIAQSLGGGGHTRAAGVRMVGTISDVEERVLGAIDKALKAQVGGSE